MNHDPLVISLKKPPPAAPSPRPPERREEPHRSRPRRVSFRRAVLFAFLVVAAIALLAYIVVFGVQGKDSALTVDEKALVAHVGQLVRVPEGEEPVIAAISDLEPLKDQAFFKNASVGDIVIMYLKARRVILYDPREEKVLEVAPITEDISTP